MIAPARRLLIGVCLVAQRSVSYHMPRAVAASLSSHARATSPSMGIFTQSRRRSLHSSRVVMQAVTMQDTIESRLMEALSPVHLEVINESHMHSGPAKESHFKVVVVSEKFEGKSLVARHRMVNELFAAEMKSSAMHALSIQGKTPSQWEAEGQKVAPSPPCMGGSKRATPSGLGLARSMFHYSPLISSCRSAVGLRHSAIAVGSFIGLVLCACSSGTAAAATTTGGRMARSGGLAGLNAKVVDKAFYSFVETLGNLLSDGEGTSSPFKEYLVMFNTAWVTTSTAPIAAAGLLGQPLGRAMVATASSHAVFALSKFTLAYGAMSAGSDAARVPANPSSRRPKPTAPAQRPSVGRPRTLLPLSRARSPVPRLPLTGTGTGVDTTSSMTIQVRRSSKSVPRVWLMVVTALGGPGVGTVASLATHRLGLISIPAVWSSVSRGSALGTLISASLCHGGSGTRLAARWAVIQGSFGVFLAFLLSLEVLLAVSVVNTVTGARRRSLENDTGGGAARGGTSTPKQRGEREREKDDNSNDKTP